MSEEKPVTILLVEAEEPRRARVLASLKTSGREFDLRCVSGGEEMWAYLQRRGRFAAPADSPRPGLILLGDGLDADARAAETRRLGANLTMRLIPVAGLGAEDFGKWAGAAPAHAVTAHGPVAELLGALAAELAGV